MGQARSVNLAKSWFAMVAFVCAILPITWARAADSPPAMLTPGQFNVSDTGAFTYKVPIAVPPGTAGMEPSLSLDYSSQGGDGDLGWGRMLSGVPSIGRCPRTLAQDNVHGSVNFDNNDRYCLEGQRLVAISGTYGANGTVYRTEIDGFSQITSYGTAGNGPSYFVVQTKAGQTMEFGNTTSSESGDTIPIGPRRSTLGRVAAGERAAEAPLHGGDEGRRTPADGPRARRRAAGEATVNQILCQTTIQDYTMSLIINGK
jgi:hypothetical protein